MEEFLEAETHKNNQLLDPETRIKFQFQVDHPKLTLRISFWIQKLTLQSNESETHSFHLKILSISF